MDALARALGKLTEKMDLLSNQIQVSAQQTPEDEQLEEEEEEEEDEQPEGAMAAIPISPQRTGHGIPSMQQLRRDIEIGREVNRRLAEMGLQDDLDEPMRTASQRSRGKRSGAARTVQDSVINDIDWPHFHIYSQPGADPMTYTRLTVPEFVYGFLHMVDQPESKFDRQVMWDILKAMMEDATEYPWPNVRNYFWIVGSHVENDRLKWSDHDEIQRLRAKHAQKHELVAIKASTTARPTEKLRCCGPYQKGQCPEKFEHGGFKHICAYCYRTKSTPYPHSELNCRRKNTDEQPKNVKGGE